MRLTPAQRWNPAAWLLLPLMRVWNARRNPTRDFPAARITRLVAALDGSGDGAIPFGATRDALRAFGPADWHDGAGAFRGYLYYALGATFRFGGDRLALVEVVLDPAANAPSASYPFKPGTLELTRSGRRLALFAPGATESDLTAALGKPAHAEALGDRRMLEYTVGPLMLEAHVEPTNRRVITLTVAHRDLE